MGSTLARGFCRSDSHHAVLKISDCVPSPHAAGSTPPASALYRQTLRPVAKMPETGRLRGALDGLVERETVEANLAKHGAGVLAAEDRLDKCEAQHRRCNV